MQPVETWAAKAATNTSEEVERAWQGSVASAKPAGDFDSLMNSTLNQNADSAEAHHGAPSESGEANRRSGAFADRTSSTATGTKSQGHQNPAGTNARHKRIGAPGAPSPASSKTNDSAKSAPAAKPSAIFLSLPIAVRGPLFLAPNTGTAASDAKASEAAATSSAPDASDIGTQYATPVPNTPNTLNPESSVWMPVNQTGWSYANITAVSPTAASGIAAVTPNASALPAATASLATSTGAQATQILPVSSSAAESPDKTDNLAASLLTSEPAKAATEPAHLTDGFTPRPADADANTAQAKSPTAEKVESTAPNADAKEPDQLPPSGTVLPASVASPDASSTRPTADGDAEVSSADTLPTDATTSLADTILNDLTATSAIDPAASNDGTGVATTDLPMKNPSETNKVAGPSVKLLPVDDQGAAVENNLPSSALVAGTHSAELGTNLNLGFAGGNHASNEETTRVLNSLDLPSLADASLRALDRTHDMLALQTMRLVESKMDALSVVIKPAIGTEISLDLRQLGDGVEARATLVRGDHQFLSEHWSDLQERLEQRGIKLAALDYGSGLSSDDQRQFQRPQATADDAAQQASAFAEFAAAGPGGGATARMATVHDGWESWA